jgi:hypothetical protein
MGGTWEAGEQEMISKTTMGILAASLFCLPFGGANAQEKVWALAYAPDGAYGWVKEAAPTNKASEEAFRNCANASKRPRECKVVLIQKGSCIALVKCKVGNDETVWASVSETLQGAMDGASKLATKANIGPTNCKDLSHWCPE